MVGYAKDFGALSYIPEDKLHITVGEDVFEVISEGTKIIDDLDESEEINACSINVDVNVDGKIEKYLVMFKNQWLNLTIKRTNQLSHPLHRRVRNS